MEHGGEHLVQLPGRVKAGHVGNRIPFNTGRMNAVPRSLLRRRAQELRRAWPSSWPSSWPRTPSSMGSPSGSGATWARRCSARTASGMPTWTTSRSWSISLDGPRSCGRRSTPSPQCCRRGIPWKHWHRDAHPLLGAAASSTAAAQVVRAVPRRENQSVRFLASTHSRTVIGAA